jgi:GntR family transcriptional repressor for pyruvate dehydrogenase complex
MARMHRQVMRVLLEDIANGRPKVGDRLPRESDLAVHFGVSRGVVRECLRGLEERGVVVVRQGSGARVAPEGRWNVLDADVLAVLLHSGHGAAALFELLECRRVIEVSAAGLAAARATGDDLSELSDALARMVAASERVPGSQAAEDLFHVADIAFHEAIFRAAGNRALLRMVQPIQKTLINARRPLAAPERRFVRALPEHKAILSAIAGRDPAAARAAMQAHLETVESYLRAYSVRQGGRPLAEGLELEDVDERFS